MSPIAPGMATSASPILLPFCCPSNPIPQASTESKLISTFLTALHAIRDAEASIPKSPTTTTPSSPPTPKAKPKLNRLSNSSTTSSSLSTSTSTSSTSTLKPHPSPLLLFPAYPTYTPLPQTLILLQTTTNSPGPNQMRSFTHSYFAFLPGKDYWALQMWPQEGFGGVNEARVEALWGRGGNWVRRGDLGGEGERKGWKCSCGREYWVRIVRFEEGERGWEALNGGESVSGWEMVDRREGGG
ncbi:hypothetical protein DL95DRAFT_498893 [Leptodontidium sp. 2 PMI_412]|nr:hypothetical protein DL95DRAFT_498893 [Leptodontidium sp. 2 PMI_412]